MNDVDVEQLVDAYLAIRDEQDVLTKNYDIAYGVLQKDKEQIEAAMLSVCNSLKSNSINTSKGTVIRKLVDKFGCSDWERFYQFIIDHKSVELLDKRINQNNFKQFISEQNLTQLPDFISTYRKFDISVRKPTAAKKEVDDHE